MRTRPTARAVALEGLIKLRGWHSGAELGVLRGDVFRHLIKSRRELHLIGVDTWRAAGEKEGLEGGVTYADHDLEAYYSDLQSFAAKYRRAQLMRMTTLDAAARVADGSLDFVFIDACHMESSVRADIRAWRPKVKPGGSLCGHDINWPSVRRAVLGECGFVLEHRCEIWERRLP